MNGLHSTLRLAAICVFGLAGMAACAYEDDVETAPLLSISEWPSGLVGPTTGIHAVVAASTDAELAPYATFALDDVHIDIAGSALQLSFVLPQGLTGEATSILLEGGRDGDLVILRSHDGQVAATCELGATMFCELDYGDIVVSDQAVAAYWNEADPVAQDAHLRVSAAFAAQPSGTMDILLRR
ncbi:MAG: hypothetical protein IPL79_04950 [Myxococcales bacterium]|nr:hypothetical protein [Myxococcales bacterium]